MYKWVEIDLDKIEDNYNTVRNYIPKEVKILGVVKADAYGHGLVEVSKILAENNADYLGVTEITEGIQVRKAGIRTPILVFSPFLLKDVIHLIENDLTATVSDLQFLEQLGAMGSAVKVHLKIETGLGRTGLKLEELESVVQLLKQNPQIQVKGIYSHLATAMWKNDQQVRKQAQVFQRAIDQLTGAGIDVGLRHLCNSAALMKFPEYHYDMVRAGTIIYGQEVHNREKLEKPLNDSWSLKGEITYINHLPAGQGIGYERTFKTKRPTTVAIVPIGFSHGLGVEPILRSRKLIDLVKIMAKSVLRYINHSSMRIYGEVNGKKAPVIGKIGMQLIMLDVTDIPGVELGSIVQLPGRRTNISTSLPRIFIRANQPVKVRKMVEVERVVEQQLS